MTTAENKQRFVKAYMNLVIGFGALFVLFSGLKIDTGRFDLRLAAIVAITVVVSRFSISMPAFRSQISVSDTFIFLTMLLYGGPIATLLAGTEAFLSSLRFSKKPTTILFNTSCAACSTFLTATALTLFVGNVAIHRHPVSPIFIIALSIMALVQYAVNSGVVAICGALRAGEPIWSTWRKHYLWTSITYFAGASAAGLIAKLVVGMGTYLLIVTAPIVAIVFFTYRTYLKNVESSIVQAQQAEKHVQELSHYITEQERIREQFSQVEKLSALGELASGVAHDFNNTLAGILGRAQLLLRTDDPEKIRRGLGIIIKAAEDGAKTVRRIQDFARQRRDHDFQPVSVSQLLLDVSEITRPRWKDKAEATNIQIGLNLQIHSKSSILGDESELREVLVNMVFNAVDAMSTGGELTLAAEDLDGSVVITIADTGMGMTPEVRSRIFDPFFTTKGKAGMGLGLAVSFGIIRRHEGTVEVDSEVGKGSRFRISLPMAKMPELANETSLVTEQLTTDSYPVSITQSRHQNQPTMLVVDDEETVRDLLGDILESAGWKVIPAPGGREALALFDSCHFDGVFTDVGMPGMKGWELAQAIRQRNSAIPIAVITGWGEAVGSDEQKAADVDWVVTKPFSAERIFELTAEINSRSAAAKRASFAIVAA